jgi:hypothetical protein
MRFSSFYLACFCIVCLCACTKPPASQDYDPAQAPLTADELAQLLGIDHWKINALPKSDVPYWGVRVVARKADNSVVGVSTPERFGTSVTADGNNQILVGIRREADGFSGTLMLGTRPEAVALTRFTFSHPHDKDNGWGASIGLSWRDDRAELISCTDANQQKTFSISVELLHDPPN